MNNFEFGLIQLIESYALLIVSFGIWIIRFFFNDFLNHQGKYSNRQIIFLMIPTVFVLEVLLAVFITFYYVDIFDPVSFSASAVKYLLVIPKIIFYLTLFYFLYWLLRMFQKKQDLYIHSDNEEDFNKE